MAACYKKNAGPNGAYSGRNIDLIKAPSFRSIISDIDLENGGLIYHTKNGATPTIDGATVHCLIVVGGDCLGQF